MTTVVHTQIPVDTILKELQSLDPRDVSNPSLSPIVDQIMSLENSNLTTENVRTLYQIGQSLKTACSSSPSVDQSFKNLADYILTFRQLPDKRGLVATQLNRNSTLPRNS